MTDEAAHLAAVLAAPGDDLPRLVYADWLDDHGRSDYGEFIRLQCELARRPYWVGHWPKPGDDPYKDCPLRRRERELWVAVRPLIAATVPPVVDEASFELSLGQLTTNPAAWPRGAVRRGFVAEVRLTLAAFAGGPCGRCGLNPDGRLSGYLDDSDPTRWDQDERGPVYLGAAKCPACSGTGRTPGVARELFRSHPVERVVLTDRRPAHYTVSQDYWFWASDAGQSTSGLTDQPYFIPDPLCRHLKWYIHPTEAAARDALSAAAPNYGRSLNDLPLLRSLT